MPSDDDTIYMYRYLILCLFALIGSVSAQTAGMISIAGSCQMPMAEGWIYVGDPATFPVQLMLPEYDADLSVFESPIGAEDAIHSPGALKTSVDGVIDEVILTLPGAELLSNTGYHHTSTTGFALEFLSFDTTRNLTLHHRLYTALYSKPDGSQVMYTLWGKAPAEYYEVVATSLMFMQEGFAYTGDRADSVFPAQSTLVEWGWFVVLGMALISLVLVRRRRGFAESRASSVS